MSSIEIKDVRKTYNHTHIPVHAVNGINISFDEGEFAAIVGPSGSGKTTLLNIMGGLDVPTEGSVIIDEVNVSKLSKGARTKFRLKNIGFVFQAYNLIPVLTAFENTAFIMELQGIEPSKIQERTQMLLKEVGLGDRGHSRPSQLSGGQQQRVAVARALAPRPRFILADEPTANLDSKSTAHLLDVMLQLNKEENITFIFSTHDNRVVQKARRIITVEDGKVVSDEKKG